MNMKSLFSRGANQRIDLSVCVAGRLEILYLEFKYSLERKIFLVAQLVLVVNDSEY